VGPNEVSKGIASGGAKKAPKQHARAVSLNGDTEHFGFDQQLIDDLSSLTEDVADFYSIFETLSSEPKPELDRIKADRDNLVGLCSRLVSEIEAAGKVYYEGKSLHEWHLNLAQKAESQVKKAMRLLKDNPIEVLKERRLEMLREGDELAGKKYRELKATLDAANAAPGVDHIPPPIKEGYGKKLVALERAPVEVKLSWADLVEEELEERERATMSLGTQSLSSVIRGRMGAGQDSRVEIPGNLEETLPLFYKRMVIACRFAKCELVKNQKILLKLARPDVFGSDEKARDDVLDSLYDEKGNPKKELLEVADLSVLIDTLLEIPTAGALNATGPGRLGIHHTVNLIMRVYAEQVYSVPIAKQSRWWKGGATLRGEMIARVASQVGGLTEATSLINAFDILYRKFIRSVLNGKAEKAKLLRDTAAELSKNLFVSGAGLFNNLLREETRVKKVEEEVLAKNRTSKKIVERKYKARIRPTISDGPKTPFEIAIYAKVNTALAKAESLAVSYNMDSDIYSSPKEWEEDHASWVENLYTRTKIPSSIMTTRKQAIRAIINAEIAKTTTAATGQTAAVQTKGQSISSAQWTTFQARYISEHEEKFDNASIKALNDVLGTTLNKDGLLKLTEADILRRLDWE